MPLYENMFWKERRVVRLEYVKTQDGKCYFCKSDIHAEPPADIRSKKINWSLFPSNFLKNPIHLHHSHKTGLTLGAVHARCNAVLWQYHGE